jgi:hypothetical protein
MVSRHIYSRILRTIGQALEKRHIDLFDLRCHQNEFFLQCGDPTPPHLSLVELRYTLADLDDLDLDAETIASAHLSLSISKVYLKFSVRSDTELKKVAAICYGSAIPNQPTLTA